MRYLSLVACDGAAEAWNNPKGKVMDIIIYVLAGLSIILAVGGLVAWEQSKNTGLLISSIVSIGFSATAIILPHWWPLVVGFAINWMIKPADTGSGS